MFQPDLFSGKTALVTGGGSGIGQEIARQFLKIAENRNDIPDDGGRAF